MTEPTVSRFPTTGYDNDTTLLGDQIDQRNFTLLTGVDDSIQTIEISGSIDDVDVPCYIFFADGNDEIIHCVSKSGTNFTSVDRGARGSTAQSHSAGASMYLIVSGQQVNMFRNAILAGQAYFGLVGVDASKSGSPAVNEVYVATDTDKVYVCLTAGVWTSVGGSIDHGDLLGLLDDDHSQYHITSRALTWHNAVVSGGGHVSGGDTHDHGYSYVGGVGRVSNGTTRSSTPTYAREIYYETDTEDLYISKNNSAPSDWIKIVGAPTGAIVAFTEAIITSEYSGACPSGWTRFTALDGRLAKGAPTGVTSPLNTGGGDTHTHDYTDILQHTHSVTSKAASLATESSHSHSIAIQGAGAPDGLAQATSQSDGNYNTESDGSHSHTFDIDLHSSNATKRTSDDAAGVATGTTETGDSWPPFQEIIWCQKD